MTREEFEALQVGDVIEYDESDFIVIDAIDCQKRTVTCARYDGRIIRLPKVNVCRVVSRVITRENVQAKGGE